MNTCSVYTTLPDAWVVPRHVHTTGAWAALLWKTEAGAAPRGAYTTETWALNVFVYTQVPELHLKCTLQRPLQHLVVSTPQWPELHLDLSAKIGLCCPWLVYTTEACAALWRVYRPLLLFKLSTPQYRGLSCTWTCLAKLSAAPSCLHHRDLSCRCTNPHWRGLYCSWRCLHHSTEAWAALGRVWATVACAALGLIYTTDACAAFKPLYTMCLSFTSTCLHYRVLYSTWTGFL